MPINFKGYGGNVVGSLGSGSMVQDMPSAMQLNGTNAYASGSTTMSTVTGTTATIAMWVYYTGSQTNQGEKVLFSDSSSETRKILMQTRNHSSHGVSFRFGYVDSAGGGHAAKDTGGSAGVLTSGTWQHFAIVTDGNNVGLYVDGELYSDGSYASAGSHSYAIANPHLGRAAFSDGRYFPGYIRDVQVYNVSSSTAQLGQIMKGELPHGTPIHWWTCDDGATNDDGSATDSDLTLTNTVEDKSFYKLNQFASGSVSGSVTISGGTWNLLDSNYLDFNGTNAYCNIPTNSSLDEPKTIAFWCKPDQIKAGANNAVSRGSNDYEIYFHNSTNTWWNYWGTKFSTGADGPPVGVGQWQHIVCTLDDSTSPPTVRWYKDGALYNTDPLSGTPAYSDDGVLNIGRDASEENDYLDGIIKDVMLYSTKLTDTQVDLLYKGQWVGNPEHWWKLDEGTGNGEDSGQGSLTAQTQNTTWVKPDYNVNDGVTTISGSVLSAPQGVLSMGGANWGPSTFIHNSGTVTPTNAGVVEWEFSSDNAGSDNALYNLATNAAGQMRFTTGYIVENIHSNSGGNGYNYLCSNRTYNYGTTSSAASSSALLRSVIGTATNYANIYGVSELHPVKLKYWDETPHSTNVAIKNVKVEDDIDANKFAGGDLKVRLDGDCEFDVVNVVSGETFDLNGQRAEFNGNLDMESGVTFVGSGALLVCNDKIKTDGATVYNSGTSVICGHAGTSTIRFNDGDWENLMYNPTGGGVCFDTNANVANNLIVAGGYYDMQTVHLSGDGVGKLQIAKGGEFRGGDDVTHEITDTFNMAGGFIGQGAINVTGVTDVSAQYMTAASFDDLVGASEATIECWFRASDSSPESAGLVSLFPAAEWNINVNKSGSDLYLGWEWENHGTEIFKSNGPLLGPSNAQKWHHAAMTIHDTNGYKVYLDGKLVASGGANGNDADVSSVALTVGSSYYSTNYLKRGFSGDIARASVWKVALTETEIRSMLFEDWTTMAAANVVDDSKCVAWYEFSDSQGALSVTDKSGNGNTGTLSADVWAGPGTFTYDTCTLKFDKAGTCYLIGHQDATATNMYSVHITSGTTVEANCRDNDLIMNSGSLMTNSGTLNSNRNWQYKSRNMPIVGANSDLTVGNTIWYYMGDGSGLPVSGAGTNYSQLRPASNVYMQGDFDCANDLLQSGGDLHLNGYKCTTTEIHNYGGGNIWAEPGSSIEFDTTGGFNKMYGASPTTMTFVASGEAAYQATTDAAGTNTEGVYTNTEVVTSGTSQMSVSYWIQIPSDSNFWDTSLLRCVWGFGGIFTGDPTVASHPGMWAHTIQSSYIKNDFYSYDNPADADDDFNRIHENATRPINWTGTGPYGWHHICTTVAAGTAADTLKTYVDGVEVDSRQKPKEFLIVGNGTPGLSVHGAHLNDNYSSYGTQMSIADFRIYKDITLTSGNTVTLASENPATSVSGAYADPDNALGATLWWKLNATPSGTLDTTDSAGTNHGTAFGGAKTGFVRITSTATPYEPINNIYPAGVTLQNVYMSGSKDIIVGQTNESSAGKTAHTAQFVKTRGTVVLE